MNKRALRRRYGSSDSLTVDRCLCNRFASSQANEDSSSGDGDDDNDSLLSLYSYSSYLAFEGFSLVDKIKVLSNESLEGRLMDGCRILGEKENEMRAKCMIKNLAEEWEEKN